MIALQARMQASYQDHMAQTQRLNAKVSSNIQVSHFLDLQFRLVHLSLLYAQFILKEHSSFRSSACRTSWKKAPMPNLHVCSRRTPFSVTPSTRPRVRPRASESFPNKRRSMVACVQLSILITILCENGKACVLTFCVCVSLFHSIYRQNAELAKLRQECAKLTKELGEKTESLLADENIRKGLEAKVAAAEKQLSLVQVGPEAPHCLYYTLHGT